VIPQIRGEFRSRPMENIIAEAKELSASGCKELMLIAQDVTEYGRDLYGELKLPELLKELCKVEGIRWIRLMYCYEDKITDELIQVMAEEEKICNYIDIPLQHISDNVLGAMNRRSTSASIRDTVARLRKAIPDIHIRTTFIVGFPGETDEDVNATLELLKIIRYKDAFMYYYNPREGTPAAKMTNQIPLAVKKQRLQKIIDLQLEITTEELKKRVGKTVMVLCQSVSKDNKDELLGKTEQDERIVFKAEKSFIGKFVKVQIDSLSGNTFKGHVIN
jgi:MiaB/RimO family radical SAM methylthiotransferase